MDASLESQLKRLVSSPAISATAVSAFGVRANAITQGVDVAFILADATGVDSITLLRNQSMDVATATVIQTWTVRTGSFAYSDSSQDLAAQPKALYYLVLNPQGTNGTAVTIGPQSILLNAELLPPLPLTSISVSHGGLVNGTVLVTVNVTGIASSIRILALGYHGSATYVGVAQQPKSPIQFALDQTGETITLEAIGVSAGGAAASSGPTATLTLNSTATVPASPQGVIVAQISSGNQITFPANRDAVTSYKLYRGDRGSGFLLATLLATLAGGSGTIEYLDTGGLAGDFEYYLKASGPAGDSVQSGPFTPAVLYSSATMPPNVPGNTTNTATVDSIDTGSAALIRVYGAGGPGTSYSRLTGFGSITRPNGTISGLAYATNYGIVYSAGSYLALASYAATLPDGYEWVGAVKTTGPTGVIGSGATAAAVIDGGGHVIQINSTAVGTGYATATVNISGGGGSNAQATANVDGSGTIPSYTVTNGGTGYATAPTVTVLGAASSGTTSGGGSTGGQGGSRFDPEAELPA